MKHLLVFVLVFTVCLCSGEVLTQRQVQNVSALTKPETTKPTPAMPVLISSEEPATATFTSSTQVIKNQDTKEEKEDNSKAKPSSDPSNRPHSAKKVLSSGQTDEQGITLLKAISAKVLVAQNNSIDIVDLSTDRRRPSVLENEGIIVYSVDFHWHKRLVFFSANDSIYRVDFLSKSNIYKLQPIVSHRVDGAVRLAVDWIHDNLYWVCDKYQSVEMADLDGKNRQLLYDNIKWFEFPNNIVVDPFNKLIFFVSNYSLFRANLDGSKLRHVAVDQNELGDPNWGIKNIALDRNNKTIYTTGKFRKSSGNNNSTHAVFISRINYDGTPADDDQKNRLPNPTNWTDIYSLEVFQDSLYFAHYDPNEEDKMYELSLTTKDAEPRLKFVPRFSSNGIWSIKLVHPCVQLHQTSGGQCS